jgi:hypothetical protein
MGYGYPMLALVLAACSQPLFVDGPTPLVKPPGTPIGHYLGPDGVVASGLLADGAPFVLFDHTLFIGRNCKVQTYEWGDRVDLKARSLTVVEAPGWRSGTLGHATWATDVKGARWACDDRGPEQILRMPDQPAIGFSAEHVALVR